jgi:hypothetical protein
MRPKRPRDDSTLISPVAAANDREPRRSVELTGFCLLGDGTSFGIRVLDLSHDGCRVEAPVALLPGVALQLSVLGLGDALDAIVRWYNDGKAGLQFAPKACAKTPEEHRQRERLELSAALSLRRQGRPQYQARLFDLTVAGCRVEFVERPRTDELLWVKFEGLNAIEAKVRWVDGFYGGLEFVQPIHAAVFDLLLIRLT